jgi:Uma2 family endonuclease
MSAPLASFEFPDDGEHSWPAQGHWTYDDYLRLPDDRYRYEVIRGVLYRVPSRSCGHQVTIGRLIRHVGGFVIDSGLGVVLTAFDVILPGIATPAQPDLLFLRKGSEPRGDACYTEGPLELLVEVLAPETMSHDQELKLAAYEEAGVQEYWLVDPMARTVVIHVLGRNGRYAEFDRGGEGDTVRSRVLEGFSLRVMDLFPLLE